MPQAQVDHLWLLDALREIHDEIRTSVVAACEQSSSMLMSQVAADDEGDTIYAIDRISESKLVDLFERKIASRTPIVLIAEGIAGGKITLPHKAREQDAKLRIIADPIDGTRGLMYQKRSGWILTGVAPNHGDDTTLADIILAVQTEIPLVKQHLSDTLWAVKGKGAQGQRFNRLTGDRTPLSPRPSTAETLEHGFSSIARFFPGGRDVLAAIDDAIAFATAGNAMRYGKAYCFEDQYLSTGGQLYELMMGHDRFLADLRPLLLNTLQQQSRPSILCCHPYDLCTELIARESGVLITGEMGETLRARLNVEENVGWAGYCNDKIQQLVEPVLQSELKRRGLA